MTFSENLRITIVILAAGASERLGSPKQLLQYKGISLVRHITRQSLDSRAQRVVVVLGADYDVIEPEIARQHVVIVRNPDWQSGIGSSIRAGVAAAQDSADGILLTLSDQPLVTTPYLNSLIEEFRKSPSSIVASRYSGTLGVPALFPSTHFSELLDLPGDQGAKAVILRSVHLRPESDTGGQASSVIPIDFPEGSVDIDTLSDLKKFTS